MIKFLSQVPLYLKLARLHQPSGIGLVLLPCWWGLFLSQPPFFPFKYFFLFLIGAILMRSAGCTYNDMVDRKYDRHVRRTASRPLASGKLTFSQGLFFLAVQLLGSLIVLLQFPSHTVRWGMASLILVLIYPWMKRVTYWPQAFLGLTFNWGIFLGWSLYQPSFTGSPLLLYMVGLCWTLGYDTIYAHQDTQDDPLAGVKSSALALKHHTYTFLSFDYLLMILLLIVLGWLENLSKFYYGGLCFVALHLIWQVVTLDVHDPENCRRKFKANVMTGLLILGSFWSHWFFTVL